jgi:hypothetical protein
VDSSFLPELRERPAENLDELNSLFSAWLEQGYHHWTNREIGETPAARFARALADIRLPDPVRLRDVFLWQEKRTVDKASQFSLQNNRYEVDPRLAGGKIQIRYDPFDLSVIQVWSDGQRFDDAQPHELVRQHDRRVKPRPENEVSLSRSGLSYLNLLLERHRSEAKQDLGGISFHRDKEGQDDV